MIIQAIIVP